MSNYSCFGFLGQTDAGKTQEYTAKSIKIHDKQLTELKKKSVSHES
jgi:hypothetical protein